MRSGCSIVGLGKLGASMLAAIASRGIAVIGVDVDRRAVDLINAGEAPVQETDLGRMIAANRGRIKATVDYEEAILNTDLTFVIVPTPSDSQGAFSLEYAAKAFREIGRALAKKKGYHNVVLTSTVLPGSMRYGLLPILEHESGKTAGSEFGLCYSPEFIALGSVIRNFLNPDFTLVGELDKRSGDQLEAFYDKTMMNDPPCMRMSFENAELAKISVNAFVTMKITFANMLADLCERIPGGDVDIVTEALGCDQRIGHRYLKGGLGYGGPCFPRDNKALGFVARAVGCKAEIPEATDARNESMPDRLAQELLSAIPGGATVGLLGLAYKPFSHVIEESQSIYLARALAREGLKVVGYDPLAGGGARRALFGIAEVTDTLEACLEQTNVLLVCTPDPCFKVLVDHTFTKRVLVIDFWRFLEEDLKMKAHIDYVAFGRGADRELAVDRLRRLWTDH